MERMIAASARIGRVVAHMVTRHALVAAALVGSACAPAGPMTLASSNAPGRHPWTSRTTISAEELVPFLTRDTYEALVHLRPEFLRKRGPTSILANSPYQPAVYVDRQLVGGVEALTLIPVDNVAEIRFLDASAATMAYGSGFQSGVIDITTVH